MSVETDAAALAGALGADGAEPGEITARPIFVLGTLRSGASLLTASLGQHPNILHLLDNAWLPQFTVALQRAYAAGVRRRDSSHLEAAGIEVDDFFVHFGEAINRLFLQPPRPVQRAVDTDGSRPPVQRAEAPPGQPRRPQRWVDGTPENSRNVVGLVRLFPRAKFIHIVRDVRSVVASLTSRENRTSYRSRHVLMTEKEAYEHWLTTVRACLEAEHAFGSETILRVRRDDLLAEPERTLRRCLDFVGEPFAEECLRPFR